MNEIPISDGELTHYHTMSARYITTCMSEIPQMAKTIK